jgi:hypothetical protein
LARSECTICMINMGQFSLYTGPVFPEYFTHTDPDSGPSSIPTLAPADLSQLCSWFLHHVPFKIMPIAPNMVIYTYCMYVVGATDVLYVCTSVPKGIIRQFCSILWGPMLASSNRLINWGIGIFLSCPFRR